MTFTAGGDLSGSPYDLITIKMTDIYIAMKLRGFLSCEDGKELAIKYIKKCVLNPGLKNHLKTAINGSKEFEELREEAAKYLILL